MSEQRRDDQRPDDTPQTLVSHLLELRNRLLKTLVVVLVIFLGLFYFSRDLYTLVARPLMDAMPAGTNMIAHAMLLRLWGYALLVHRLSSTNPILQVFGADIAERPTTPAPTRVIACSSSGRRFSR